METNEERREIAAKLRMLASHKAADEELVHDTLGLYRGENIEGYDTYGVMHLADLIEPEPERTCHKELMITEDYRGTEVEYFGCSECGQWLSGTDCYGLGDGPNYCENCGCKVDSSFVTDENTGEVIYRDGEKVVE